MFLVRGLCRLHDGLTDAGYVAGTLALFSMAAIYCYEVLTRYFLGLATDWANDTFSNLLVITVFAMVPHATRMGQHISISLLAELVPSWRSKLALFANSLGVAVCLFAAWMSLDENLRHIQMQLVTEQNHPLPKIWMSSWITYGFVGAALYFLRATIPAAAVRPISWITPRRAELTGGA